MASRFFLVTAVLLGLSCTPPAAAAGAPATAPGHWLLVEPVRFYNAEDDLYRAIVAEKFSENQGFVGGCFSMVSLTDDRAEEIVYAGCSTETTQASASLVHMVAAESIADKLKTSGFEAARAVKVRRSEVAVSAADSRLLRETWLKMLIRTEVETGTRLREPRLDYFFSALRAGTFQGRLGGVAKNPSAGTPAARLVEIGQLLARTADSVEEKRSELMKLVRTKATELSRTIDRGKK